MQLVIDANIVMAMLIKPGKPIDLFFNEDLEIFAPELLFKELENNKQLILSKSQLSEDEIDTIFSILKNKIIVIPEHEFLSYRESAEVICPDPKDIVYFALALHLKCGLWSNEKRLKEQSEIDVFFTHELLHMFSNN